MPYYTLTFEDYSPFITYSSGDWSPGGSRDSLADQYSQSTFMLTTKGGATATIAFNGTGITVYGAKRPNHGLYQANLDGQNSSPVNGSSKDLFDQALFQAHNLDQGLHRLQITNQNDGLYLDIDYVTIEGNVGENNNGKLYVLNYQDSDDSFNYLPSPSQWSANPDSLGTFSGLSGHSTTTAGASFDFSFNVCDGVSLFGPLSKTGAPYTVSLDGAPATSYSTVSDRYLPQALLFHATSLGAGQHHLKVSYTPNGNNQVFAVDYANVYTTNSSASSGPSNSGGDTSSTNGGTADSGLSAGAAAGIAVAASIVAALLVALAFLLMRRRKRQHVEDMKQTSTVDPYTTNGHHRTNLGTPSSAHPSTLPGTFGSGAAAAGIPTGAMAGVYATGSTSNLNSGRHHTMPSESNTSLSIPARFASNAGGSSDGGITDMYGDLPSPVGMTKPRLNAGEVQRERLPGMSPPDYLQATYGRRS